MHYFYFIVITLSFISSSLMGQQAGCTDESSFNYDMMAAEPCNETGLDNDCCINESNLFGSWDIDFLSATIVNDFECGQYESTIPQEINSYRYYLASDNILIFQAGIVIEYVEVSDFTDKDCNSLNGLWDSENQICNIPVDENLCNIFSEDSEFGLFWDESLGGCVGVFNEAGDWSVNETGVCFNVGDDGSDDGSDDGGDDGSDDGSDDGGDDGPPECLLDCPGIEFINPDQDPNGFCAWIIDANNSDCVDDCDSYWDGLLNSLEEACEQCLSDYTFDCEEIFNQDDCNPDLICGEALTCVDGLLYPTTCGPDNCDEAISKCDGDDTYRHQKNYKYFSESNDFHFHTASLLNKVIDNYVASINNLIYLNNSRNCFPFEYDVTDEILLFDFVDNENGECIVFTLERNSDNIDDLLGCTDSTSSNYNPGAFFDDGSCDGNTNIMGDINSDNEINILDVVLLINFVLQVEFPSSFEFESSDINEDGALNVLDIVQLVNLILGQ